jgi:hypothetical protein
MLYLQGAGPGACARRWRAGMNIIDRYLALAAARATLLVMIVLLALIGFISLTNQLQDVGRGNFQVPTPSWSWWRSGRAMPSTRSRSRRCSAG